MSRPSLFDIMRINRGCGGYFNEKAQLLDRIDCVELDALRDLRRRQRQEHLADNMATTQPMPPRREEMVKLAAAMRQRYEPRSRLWQWLRRLAWR